jgi:3-(methylthio)propanoyl-CoA dehydrogenase
VAAQIEATEAELRQRDDADAHAVAARLAAARKAFLDVVDFVVAKGRSDPNAVYAGSVPYLMLAGNLVAGWQLGRALLVAERKRAAGEDVEFMRRKIAIARFYAEHVLTRAPGLRDSIVDGADAVNALAAEAF